ncbi:MAG: hypothetical protein EON92_03465 [Burkholderiales bacterium]|nr:MAG: hypothetical protein EON92_03465 [Burkholderiales bacterium]
MSVRKSNTYDNLLLLKDAGAVTANGVATVGGQARVLDVGQAAVGPAKLVIDTSALTGTGTYDLALQGSTDLAFTTPVELASTKVTAVGRQELPFDNQQDTTIYRYLRVFVTVGGSSPSVNATVFAAKG